MLSLSVCRAALVGTKEKYMLLVSIFYALWGLHLDSQLALTPTLQTTIQLTQQCYALLTT